MAEASVSSSAASHDDTVVHIQVAYRGQNHDFKSSTESTLAEFQGQIADLTKVDATNQKLLGSGPLRNVLGQVKENEAKTLKAMGVVSTGAKPIKVMLVGPTNDELDQIQKGDMEAEKRNRPRQYHPSMLRGGKPRNTNSPSISSPFNSLKVHSISPPSSPEYDQVMSRLRQFSTDPAVLHVCQLHGFQVGELTELLPHEHPNLLGLNENMGQRISIRVRTMKYDGLINYRETRRVLFHELVHNKINGHPVEFKILNSELNAQVEAYERQVKQATHFLSDMDVYVPPEDASNQDSIQETSHVLGGAEASRSDDGDLQSKRQRVLMATMKRLEKSEEEIQKGCGSA